MGSPQRGARGLNPLGLITCCSRTRVKIGDKINAFVIVEPDYSAVSVLVCLSCPWMDPHLEHSVLYLQRWLKLVNFFFAVSFFFQPLGEHGCQLTHHQCMPLSFFFSLQFNPAGFFKENPEHYCFRP